MVPTPSAPADARAARSAHEAHSRPHELLRRKWKRAESGHVGRTGRAGLVQVAAATQSTNAPLLETLPDVAHAFPSARAAHFCAAVGPMTASRTSGGAGWFMLRSRFGCEAV